MRGEKKMRGERSMEIKAENNDTDTAQRRPQVMQNSSLGPKCNQQNSFSFTQRILNLCSAVVTFTGNP